MTGALREDLGESDFVLLVIERQDEVWPLTTIMAAVII